MAGRRIPRHLLVLGAVADWGGPGGDTQTGTAAGQRATLVFLVMRECLDNKALFMVGLFNF